MDPSRSTRRCVKILRRITVLSGSMCAVVKSAPLSDRSQNKTGSSEHLDLLLTMTHVSGIDRTACTCPFDHDMFSNRIRRHRVASRREATNQRDVDRFCRMQDCWRRKGERAQTFFCGILFRTDVGDCP